MGIEDIVAPLEANEAVKRSFETESPMSMEGFVEFTKFILEDTSIPKKWQDLFWAFSDKENAVGFIEKEDIDVLMNMWEITKLTYLMSRPDFEYKFPDMLELDNFRAKYFMKVKRSKNANERRLLATQIRQITTDSVMKSQKKGILSRIFGTIGGGQGG